MKRFSALFTLMAALFLLYEDARAQQVETATLFTLNAVSGPDSLHAKCVPFLGDTVTVMANQLYNSETTVTGMWADSTNNAYMIELDGSLRLFNLVERCASVSQGFYAWMRVDGYMITKQPVLIFPNGITPQQENYFLKEAR